MKKEEIKISEQELAELTRPLEKRKIDAYYIYLLLKRAEGMPEKSFLVEELSALFKNYSEIVQREANLSQIEKEDNPQLQSDLITAKTGLSECLALLRAELVCRGIDNLPDKESFGGDYRLAELVREKKEDEIIRQAAKILYEHCFKVLEGKVPDEVDANEIRRYFIRQMDEYINFLDSIRARKVSNEVENLKEACIYGDKNYRWPSEVTGEDRGDDDEGEEWKKGR